MDVLRAAAGDGEATSYELSGGTLRVVGPIGYDLNPQFRAKCDELLASDAKDLVLDLSMVLYLSSSHLGVLARLMTQAAEAKKTVLVRTNKKAARVLALAGIDRLGRIEVVGD